jgi:VanZ family protein
VFWSLAMLVVHFIPRAQIEATRVSRNLAHTSGADKLVHAGMFALFLVLWSRAGGFRPSAVAAAGLAYGAALEFLQDRLVQGRSGSLEDLAADALGLIVGLAVLAVGKRLGSRPEG